MIRPLVAGNWKMNGLNANLDQIRLIAAGVDATLSAKADILVCPPFTLIQAAAVLARGSAVQIGGQDCHPKASGAHTGDISAEMLKDCGALAIIVGHSERRTDHKESNSTVKAKADAVLLTGLQAIICIGETKSEREAGETLSVIGAQLDGSVPEVNPSRITIAYEPVWAIGTGLVPTLNDVAQAHAFIRKWLVDRFGREGEKVRILYGGSVKPSNSGELMAVANVNGALVGGASLIASDFLGIAAAYR